MMRRERSKDTDPGDERRIVVGYKGEKYAIPVDENGNVPVHALVSRFQQFGGMEHDLDDNDPTLYPMKCRPEDIVKWWANPHNGDILSLDTKTSMIYDVSSVKGKAMKKAQRRIGIISDNKIEQKRIRKILEDSFTAAELDEMSRDGSFIIKTVPNCGDATGYYLRRQDGIEIPLIVVEEGTTADGVVHEVVHHARTLLSRKGVTKTVYPMTKDGKVDVQTFNGMSKTDRDRLVNAEEAYTVAETVVRTKTDKRQSGYYDNIPGKRPREAYLEDRRIMSNVPEYVPDSMISPQKGRSAVMSVNKNAVNTNIAMAEILAREPARKSYENLKRKQRR